MDFHLSKEHLLVRKMYREFAETEVKPLAEELDEEERFPMETVEKMAKLGMMGIYFPKQYGGAGGDVLSYAMCVEELAKVIATCAVALLGYTTTMPQPTDPYTSGIFWMTLAIKYGLPMLGWVITLIAMPGCPLTKEEMVNVQKRIADKKDALRHEVIAENMQ